MEFEVWEPQYRQILEDFGFSRDHDEQVARELDATLGGRRSDDAELRTLLEGQEVTVAGNGPNLPAEIDRIRGVLVTADEATTGPLGSRCHGPSPASGCAGYSS